MMILIELAVVGVDGNGRVDDTDYVAHGDVNDHVDGGGGSIGCDGNNNDADDGSGIDLEYGGGNDDDDDEGDGGDD